MKSNGSVVTYLIFEFLIPACYTYTIDEKKHVLCFLLKFKKHVFYVFLNFFNVFCTFFNYVFLLSLKQKRTKLQISCISHGQESQRLHFLDTASVL